MENGGVTMVYYRTFKPQGKVRRRVQDLRIPSSYLDYIINRPPLDLSHNESTRLAVDSLLSQGLKGYHEMLNAEGEVDFLSALEKIYILKNGMDGCTGSDPDASDDKFESLFAYSESALTCPVTSTDSDKTLAPSSQNGVKQTEDVQDEPNIEIYFQSGSRAASMKDLVRNFIRKATMALAIVMDCFSDVELLCDLLEACRKRNVSVHLLLDHLNLNLFVSMWQDLKLDSKNFPKLSVRSVVGHTYRAKTGRKLTGQIAESFIITDWTEALTGSYSFSWLSWQVHRSHAFHVKGSAVLPFHQEFHRLNSSSRPVPGFVTYISVPKTIYNTLQASQKDQNDHGTMKPSQTKQPWNENARNIQTIAMEPVSPEPWSSVSERSKDNTQYPHGRQTHNKPPQLHPKPLLHPEELLSASVGEPKQAVGVACTQHTSTTNVKPLEKIPNHKQSFVNPHSQTQMSSIQSDLSSLTITPAAGELPEPNPVLIAPPAYRQHRSPCFKTFINPEQGESGAERLFFQQRKRDGLFKAPGTAAGTNTQRRDWYTPPKFKPKVDFQSNHSHVLSPSTPWKKEVKTGFISLLTRAKDHMLRPQTKVSHLGPRMQDQSDRYTQPPFQSHQSREAPGPKSALTLRGRQFQPGSMLLSPDARAKQHPLFQTKEEVKQTQRPNWTPQGHNSIRARSRSATRYSSLRSTYEARQPAGCKPVHTSLRRSLSMTDRRATRYK